VAWLDVHDVMYQPKLRGLNLGILKNSPKISKIIKD